MNHTNRRATRGTKGSTSTFRFTLDEVLEVELALRAARLAAGLPIAGAADLVEDYFVTHADRLTARVDWYRMRRAGQPLRTLDDLVAELETERACRMARCPGAAALVWEPAV